MSERELLKDCRDKLEIYYRATNGEYSGGKQCNDLIERIDAALAADTDKVMVPREPTPEMILAAQPCISGSVWSVREIYKAMWDAAKTKGG